MNSVAARAGTKIADYEINFRSENSRPPPRQGLEWIIALALRVAYDACAACLPKCRYEVPAPAIVSNVLHTKTARATDSVPSRTSRTLHSQLAKKQPTRIRCALFGTVALRLNPMRPLQTPTRSGSVAEKDASAQSQAPPGRKTSNEHHRPFESPCSAAPSITRRLRLDP